jgi:hypothetical protein
MEYQNAAHRVQCSPWPCQCSSSAVLCILQKNGQYTEHTSAWHCGSFLSCRCSNEHNYLPCKGLKPDKLSPNGYTNTHVDVGCSQVPYRIQTVYKTVSFQEHTSAGMHRNPKVCHTALSLKSPDMPKSNTPAMQTSPFPRSRQGAHVCIWAVSMFGTHQAHIAISRSSTRQRHHGASSAAATRMHQSARHVNEGTHLAAEGRSHNIHNTSKE